MTSKFGRGKAAGCFGNMTDYPAKRRNVWQRREDKRKWREILAIFTVIFLLFVFFNGFLKSFSLKRLVADSHWDSQSSLAIALNTKPASVLIYQKDPQRLVFVTYQADTFWATGNSEALLVNPSSVIADRDGQQLTKILSNGFGANINSYVMYKNLKDIDDKSAQKIFGDFAAITTPVALLVKGVGGDVESTNLTRLDLIRLWWQLKGLSVNKLEIKDFGPYYVEIVDKDGNKVRGFDSEKINREITKYLENSKIRDEGLKVEIVNSSTVAGAGKLAALMLESTGFKVVSVETGENGVVSSQVATTKTGSYSAKYLASVCNCAIFSLQKETAGEGTIKYTIGRDFAKKYYF